MLILILYHFITTECENTTEPMHRKASAIAQGEAAYKRVFDIIQPLTDIQ